MFKKLWNSIKGFIKGVTTGDWQGDKLGETVLPNGVGGIPQQIGELRNDVSGVTSNNEFNSQEAQKQRDFEKMMSDTSYQRAVDDMVKAGISPSMFYASGGSGASTPSGASGSSGSGQAMDVLGSIGSIMNSINTARELDYRTKQNEMPDRITSETYESLSKTIQYLMKTEF